jgi:transcription elongation factor GreA-like protein/transcription elongation GreA/GreB family factor
MKEQFEKLAATGKITATQVTSLLSLTEAGFCSHRSWGVGKISQVDTLQWRIVIDFESKSAHSMDVGFAADTLRPILPSHILARKLSEPEVLRNQAEENPLGLMDSLMKSMDFKATAETIEKILVPSIIPAEDWKKWWSNIRSRMKKSGHYSIPTRKTDPILYQPSITSLQQRYLNDFKQARGFKPKLILLNKALQVLGEFDDPQSFANEIFPVLNQEIATHQEVKPELALEGIFLRDELKKKFKIVSEETITAKSLWAQCTDGIKIVELLPFSVQEEALLSFKETYPDSWSDSFLQSINGLSAKFCNEVVEILVESGHTEKTTRALWELINQHQASSELLLWLARQKPEAFESLLNIHTMRAMLAAIERDQFNEVRSNRLRDYMLSDKQLVPIMINLADIEEVKDITRTLQFSPAFEDMDKRSILMRIVKLFPGVQSLISSEPINKREEALLVSWESLERKKNEYTELVHKRIPDNSKEIAIARSYGDLRENHEFKAAREMQKLLLKLKAEMEFDLERARGTDFRDVSTDEVGVGTHVVLKDNATSKTIEYLILGAWDFNEEKNIVSYLSPIAQVMLKKKVGQEIEFGGKKFTVLSIGAAVNDIAS